MKLIIEIPDFVYALAKKTNIIRANIECLEKAIIEGKPVKQGEWVKDRVGMQYPYRCTRCDNHHRAMYNYCPSCGAEMKGCEMHENSN